MDVFAEIISTLLFIQLGITISSPELIDGFLIIRNNNKNMYEHVSYYLNGNVEGIIISNNCNYTMNNLTNTNNIIKEK